MEDTVARPGTQGRPLRLVVVTTSVEAARRRARRLERAGFSLEWTHAGDLQAYRAALGSSPDLILADSSVGWLTPETARESGAAGTEAPLVVRGNGDSAARWGSGMPDRIYLCPPRGDLAATVGEALKAADAGSGRAPHLPDVGDTVLDFLTEGVAREDAEGRLIFVNRAAGAMLGYAPEELIGKHRSLIVPPDQEEKVLQANRRRRRGQADRYELELLHRDGHRVTVLVSGSPVELDGVFGGSLAVFTDVSEWKHGQDDLRRSKESFQRLIVASPIPVVLIGPDGLVRLWNPAAERVFGWTEAEVLGGPLPFVPPEGKSEFQRLLERGARGEWIDGLEIVRVRKDGARRNIRLSTAPMRTADGSFDGILGLLVDITDLKQTEAALRESEGKFRVLAEESPNMIFINRRGRVLYANKAAAESLGYERHEFAAPDFDFTRLIAPESHDAVQRNFRRHLAGEDVAPTTYTLLARDGRRIEGIHNTRLVEFGGELAILGIVTDVTEARHAEQALARRAAQLQVLAEIGGSLNAAAGLDELLARTTVLVQERLGYEHVSVFLNAPDGGLVQRAKAGPYSRHYPLRHTVRRDRGLVGAAASSGEAVLANDVGRDARYVNYFPDRVHTRSELCVPIRSGGETVGVLDVQSLAVDAFSESDVRVLGILADQLAAAAANAGLIDALRQSEQRYRDMTENSAVGIYRTTPDGRVLFVNPAVAHMLGFESVADLADRNLEAEGFEAQYSRAYFKERVERDGQIVGLESTWRRRDGTTIYVRESARLVRDAQGQPLYYEGTIEDISDRRRAEQALERHAQELESLYESSLETIAQKDLSALLHSVVRRAASLIGSNMGGLYLLNPDGETLTLVVSHNYERDFTGTVLRIGEGVSGRVAQTREVLALEDYQAFAGKAAAFRDIETRRLLAVPLQVGGRVVGVLNVADGRPGAFSEEEIHLVHLFADQAALAVENARLLEAERQRTGELERSRGLVEALSLVAAEAENAETIEQVMEFLGNRLRSVELNTWVALLDPGSGDLVLRYASVDPAVLRRAGEVMAQQVYGYRIRRMPNVIFERLIDDRLPTVVPSSRLLPMLAPELEPPAVRHLLRLLRVGSSLTLCVPLAVEDRVLGGLFVWGKALDERDLPALSIFARQIAALMEKIRLLGETRRRATYLEGITSVSTALRAAGSRSEMLPIILDQMMTLLNADGAAIERLGPQPGEVTTELGLGAWELWTRRIWPAFEGVRGQALKTRQLRIADAAPEPGGDGQGLVACLPLIVQQDVVGLLCVGRRQPFTETESSLISAVADMAANALHRAGVMETLEERVHVRTRELEAANTRLTELDKLKGEFVSNVSHELRTPITNIQLYLDLLRRPSSEARHDEYLGTLEGQSRRLGRLIEDLLAISRLDAGMVRLNLEAHLFDGLMAEVVTAHQVRADAKGVELVHEPHAECPPAWLSREQMHQVVTNLVANAIAYTPPGGRVVVETVCGRPGQKLVAARIWNDGPPIPEEDLPHLFERFFRGQNGRASGEPGTGLGLAICQEIVERHHGRIEVESTSSQGTAFTVWVPAAGA